MRSLRKHRNVNISCKIKQYEQGLKSLQRFQITTYSTPELFACDFVYLQDVLFKTWSLKRTIALCFANKNLVRDRASTFCFHFLPSLSCFCLEIIEPQCSIWQAKWKTETGSETRTWPELAKRSQPTNGNTNLSYLYLHPFLLGNI